MPRRHRRSRRCWTPLPAGSPCISICAFNKVPIRHSATETLKSRFPKLRNVGYTVSHHTVVVWYPAKPRARHGSGERFYNGVTRRRIMRWLLVNEANGIRGSRGLVMAVAPSSLTKILQAPAVSMPTVTEQGDRYFVKGAGRGTGGAHRVRSPARLAGPVAAARATKPASSAGGGATDQASPAPAAARGATMAAVRSRWARLASSAVAHFPPTSGARGTGTGGSARRGAGASAAARSRGPSAHQHEQKAHRATAPRRRAVP